MIPWIHFYSQFEQFEEKCWKFLEISCILPRHPVTPPHEVRYDQTPPKHTLNKHRENLRRYGSWMPLTSWPAIFQDHGREFQPIWRL